LVKGRLWKGGACTKPVTLGQATRTSTTCPSGTGRLGQTVLVPVGQVVLVPNLYHWDWERSKETSPCPMDKSYTHAGGLSLSQDKPYHHDGTCPSPTCPNLSHKVGLQGRGKLIMLPASGNGLYLFRGVHLVLDLETHTTKKPRGFYQNPPLPIHGL